MMCDLHNRRWHLKQIKIWSFVLIVMMLMKYSDRWKQHKGIVLFGLSKQNSENI